MRSLVKSLTGNELKVFIAICLHSEGGRYKNLEYLTGFNLGYPTILTVIDSLKKKRLISTYDLGKMIEVEILNPYDELAPILKSFRPQLKLDLSAGSDAPSPAESEDLKKPLHKDILHLLYYYGRAKGVSDAEIKNWVTLNASRLYQPVKKLLKYTKTVEVAKSVIDQARDHYAKQKLDWSLQGAILNNIDKFVKMKTGEKREWNW